MEAVQIDKTNNKKAIKPLGLCSSFKHFGQKMAKVLSLDADPIFKSKDWPHLWPK